MDETYDLDLSMEDDSRGWKNHSSCRSNPFKIGDQSEQAGILSSHTQSNLRTEFTHGLESWIRNRDIADMTKVYAEKVIPGRGVFKNRP